MLSQTASPAPASSGPAAPPAALEEAARALEVLTPRERRCVLRSEAGLLLDGLPVRVARSRTALDVAPCQGLGALSQGDRLPRLGWSGTGDRACERLGVAARTGQVIARLGRALSWRPLLREAVRSGAVSLRAAEEIVPVAAGADEAAWVERSRTMTVRRLVAAVRDALVRAATSEGDGSPGKDAPAAAGASKRAASLAEAAQARAAAPPAASVSCDLVEEANSAPDAEPWQRVALEVMSGTRDALLRALDLAGQVLGEGTPRWQQLEAVAQEYLGALGAGEADDEVVAGALASGRLDAERARLVARVAEEPSAGEWTDHAEGTPTTSVTDPAAAATRPGTSSASARPTTSTASTAASSASAGWRRAGSRGGSGSSTGRGGWSGTSGGWRRGTGRSW